jgi:hypothetical protein
MALLILFSVISYSLIFKPAPKVSAATIGTSSSSLAYGQGPQKHIVIANNGTLVSFFNSGTQSVTGIASVTSTDNGASWSSATQVDSAQTNDFSIDIDSSNNIYVAYNSIGIKIREMTYSAGIWTIGSANTVASNSTCVGSKRDTFTSPTVKVGYGGMVWIIGVLQPFTGVSCSFGSLDKYVTYRSTNLSSWSSSNDPGSTDNHLYVDLSGTGTWTDAKYTIIDPTATMTYGFNKLHIFSGTVTGALNYYSYDIASGTLSSATSISSGPSDQMGDITTDSHNVWVAYSSFVSSGSLNVVYKRFNGTSWSVSATALTTDNLNNLSIRLPERVPNTANVPVIWQTGTSSPYTLKSATFSNIGSVTDSGNQTGSLTGSLTGSSGDVIVKCGVWYYNTVNIVSGMTIKVCASNGQNGGNLEIHANSVTVAGTIDGAGRGYPGGLAIYGVGGIGATGPPGSTNTSGSMGAQGSNYDGVAGAGNFGAVGGTAGVNPSFDTGNCDSTGASGGGCGGAGTAFNMVGFSASSPGGYLSSGANGDSSIDESVVMGSGGGAGGTGGSGQGGGSGGSAGNTCANGGNGGKGGRGAPGGLGGNGGAYVRIYSAGTLSVSGSINMNGLAGSSGVSGEAGSNGSSGGGNANTC